MSAVPGADVRAALRVGPGHLYIAPEGSTIPTDLMTAWDAAWTGLGYTESGHEFRIQPTFEERPVAEELVALDSFETQRTYMVAFALAQITAENLQTALNGGTITPSGVAPNEIVTFEPPAPGDVTKIMIGWQAIDGLERLVWKRCQQEGQITIPRRKAPEAANIPAEFKVFIPLDGSVPWAHILDANYQAGV